MANKKNQRELVEILAPLVATRPLGEWAAHWSAADIPFESLRHMADVARDEQALVNDFMRPLTYPSGTTFYLPTPPIQFRQAGNPDYRLSADVGADTREILLRHGYSEDDITALAQDKVIRMPGANA
jgi:crotonobetainyl-CoA:carnitine CoA-transferase CaiB-like acyl-CoA transferase